MSRKDAEKKTHLVASFQGTRDPLLEITSSFPVILEDEVFLGVWTVKDLLAHMIGWDFANIQAIQEIRKGRLPSFYAHKDRDWQSFNALLVSKYKQTNLSDTLDALRASTRQLAETLEALPAGELFEDKGVRYRGYKVIISRLIEADIKDVREHLQQVRDFLANRGG